MKKIHIYLLAGLLSFTAASCENWMNIDPAGSQNTTNYWQNAGEVEAVLGTAYRNMRAAVTDRSLILWGEARGNGLGIAANNAYNLRNGNILPTNDLCKWTSIYNVIGMANSVIKYAPSVVEKDASFNEGQMKSIVAEALFLRAYSYFTLVRTFCDVPYITEPYVTDDADFWVAKTDGNTILRNEIAAIMPYIEYAKEFFPAVTDTKGRATRWALYTLVADINLWLSATDPANKEQYLRDCVTACDAVINSGRVGMIQDWFANFYPGNSNESIFELQFSNALSQTNSFTSWFNGYTGSTISANALYVSDATRMKLLTWIGPFDVRGEGASIPPSTTTYSEYTVWKYFGIDKQGTARQDTDNDQNWIIYRLAEVYLMKAEAIALQGDYDGALDIVNDVVRKRAGSDPLPKATYGGSEYNVITTIVNERSVEFFAEAKNWYDLLRTGLRYPQDSRYQDFLIDECTNYLTSISAALVRSKMKKDIPYSWYLPIAFSELEANPNLVQNPAYANYGN